MAQNPRQGTTIIADKQAFKQALWQEYGRLDNF
jgi:hypothetical protein